MKRLVRESLNESNENSFIQQFYDEYDINSPNNVNTDDVAQFINDNWEAITGLDGSEKDAEQYFPNEVEEILDELDIDYDDFSQAWGSVREGASDEYCDNCGALIDGDNELTGDGYCRACADDEENDEE